MGGLIFFIVTTLILGVAVYFLAQRLVEQSHDIIDLRNKYTTTYDKYSGIIDVDEEIKKKINELKQSEKDIDTAKQDIEILNQHIEKLIEKKEDLDADLLSLDCGLYTPKYDFDTPERYKVAMNSNKAMQKMMISTWAAIKTSFDLKSRKKDMRLDAAKNTAKLILRAFNGECDSLIEQVRWNNILKIVERLEKMFEDINALSFDDVRISHDFLKLRIEDLYLTYEYKKKLQEEKEEQARIREQMREERKIQEEIEKKQKELEEQEKRALELQKLLEQARAEGRNEASEEYESQLQDLQQQIEDSQRAVSNAQKTKYGTVYVISNIGSFGENIYKIGLTRRTEPQERVDELGDASVPFKFDVHAFIESEDAPQLEYDLHKRFENKRVNMVNERKEFYNVSLDEIIKAVNEHSNNIVKYRKEFTEFAQAPEYRETLKIREKENKVTQL